MMSTALKRGGAVLLPLLVTISLAFPKGKEKDPALDLINRYVDVAVLFKKGIKECTEFFLRNSVLRLGDSDFKLTRKQAQALCRYYEKKKRIRPASVHINLLNKNDLHRLYSVELYYTGYTYSFQVQLKKTKKGWKISLK